MVRLDPHPVLDLQDFHGGGPLEQLDHHPLLRRVQVLDHDAGHAAVGGQVAQELLDGLESPSGGADAHDGKRTASIATAGG